MRFGAGLPVGLREVEAVERRRAKRAFEAGLPAINDLERLPLRQRMLEAWETAEWAERDAEIAGVQVSLTKYCRRFNLSTWLKPIPLLAASSGVSEALYLVLAPRLGSTLYRCWPQEVAARVPAGWMAGAIAEKFCRREQIVPLIDDVTCSAVMRGMSFLIWMLRHALLLLTLHHQGHMPS